MFVRFTQFVVFTLSIFKFSFWEVQTASPLNKRRINEQLNQWTFSKMKHIREETYFKKVKHPLPNCNFHLSLVHFTCINVRTLSSYSFLKYGSNISLFCFSKTWLPILKLFTLSFSKDSFSNTSFPIYSILEVSVSFSAPVSYATAKSPNETLFSPTAPALAPVDDTPTFQHSISPKIVFQLFIFQFLIVGCSIFFFCS